MLSRSTSRDPWAAGQIQKVDLLRVLSSAVLEARIGGSTFGFLPGAWIEEPGEPYLRNLHLVDMCSYCVDSKCLGPPRLGGKRAGQARAKAKMNSHRP